MFSVLITQLLLFIAAERKEISVLFGAKPMVGMPVVSVLLWVKCIMEANPVVTMAVGLRLKDKVKF